MPDQKEIEVLEQLAAFAGEGAALLGHLAEATQHAARPPANELGVHLAGTNDLLTRLIEAVAAAPKKAAMEMGAVAVQIGANAAELAAFCFQRAADLEKGTAEEKPLLLGPDGTLASSALVDASGRPVTP